MAALLLPSACSKDESLNADRGTDYAYDFTQLVDVTLYGSEGNGFVEIKPKDLSVEDFPSESDYISVRRAMDSLGLYVGPDTSIATYLTVEPNEGLSNGDIITISVRSGWQNPVPNLSLNTEPYQVEIVGLQEPNVLNLFDESSVEFYGLSGTTSVYAYKKNGGIVPATILEPLNYQITTTDSTLETGRTILEIQAELDEDFLMEGDDPAFTSDRYFGRMGVSAELTGEKVLTTVVSPIETNTIDRADFGSAIIDWLNRQEIVIGNNDTPFTVEAISNIQQNNGTSGSFDPYTYTVIFYGNVNGEKQYVSVDLRIVELHNQYIIAESRSQYSVLSEEVALTPRQNSTIIINYENQIEENIEPVNGEGGETTPDSTTTPEPSDSATPEATTTPESTSTPRPSPTATATPIVVTPEPTPEQTPESTPEPTPEEVEVDDNYDDSNNDDSDSDEDDDNGYIDTPQQPSFTMIPGGPSIAQ